jgi:integrase
MPNPRPVGRPRKDPADLPRGYSYFRGGPMIRHRAPDPRTGKPRSTYGYSVAEIEAKLSIPIAAKHDPKLTVAAYLRQWSETRKGAVRSNSWATDADQVERVLIPYLGERLKLHELSVDHVAGLVADLRARRKADGKPLAPRTIAIARATLRKALAPAVPDRIPTNPAADFVLYATKRQAESAVKVVGVDVPVPGAEVLQAVETALRMDAELDPGLYPLFVLAAATGMRQSECLGLRWSNVDLERGRLVVVEVLVREDRSISDPKSQTSRRPVLLDPFVAGVLRARRQDQRLERIKAGRRWTKVANDLVFTDELGEPLKGRTVTRRFQRVLAKLGLPRFDWKSLRHAYVSGALEDGVDLAIVSKSAGHSSTDITGDVYAHFTPKMQREVATVATRRLIGS